MTKPTIGDVYPSLTYDDAPAAITWLGNSFGFEARLVVPGPNDRIEHSELTLGDALIMVSSPKIEMNRMSPRNLPGVNQMLSLWIDDPDGHYARAKQAGAAIVQELDDEDYGSRGYMAKDLEGHLWCFATYRPGSHWDVTSSA